MLVAPRVGAWIEIVWRYNRSNCRLSRPAWARGLKCLHDAGKFVFRLSRPAWARGLKLRGCQLVALDERSRPAWARGLKFVVVEKAAEDADVAPHAGAWIEIRIHRAGG